MGRVTFEGPVKSNNGFEIGQPGSRSSVAGTTIITSTGSINITSFTAASANLTTTKIAAGSITATTVQLTTTTAGTITIGTAITGWNNQPTTVTLSPGANVSANGNLNSVFYFDGSTTSAGMGIMPVGGYAGQKQTWMITGQSAGGVTFLSSSSVQLKLAGITGVAIGIGTVGVITLLNVGVGLATPTTSMLLVQVATAVTSNSANS